MKKQKVEPSSLVIFPNILTKENTFYFEINSVKSKRKKARRSSKQLLYLKERKKCLLSPNKNNDLWHITSLPKRRSKKRKKLVKLQEDNKLNIQSKIIFNQESDVNDQLVPFYQKSIKTNRKYVISKHQFKHFSTLPPLHSARIISQKTKKIPGKKDNIFEKEIFWEINSWNTLCLL